MASALLGILCGLYIGGGIVFVSASESRGLVADVLFLLLWPVHFARWLAGRDG